MRKVSAVQSRRHFSGLGSMRDVLLGPGQLYEALRSRVDPGSSPG